MSPNTNQSAQSLEKHGDLNEAYALKESASARIQKYGQVMYELSVKKQMEDKRIAAEKEVATMQAGVSRANALTAAAAHDSGDKNMNKYQTAQRLEALIKNYHEVLNPASMATAEDKAEAARNIPLIKNELFKLTPGLNKLTTGTGNAGGAGNGGSTFDYSRADKIVGIK